MQKWLDLIDKQCRDDVKKLLVGNKCDLTSKRVVDYQTAQVIKQVKGYTYPDNMELLEIQILDT